MQALGGAGVAASSGSRRDMGHVTHRRLPAQPQASFQQPHTLLGLLRNRRDLQGPISKTFRHRPNRNNKLSLQLVKKVIKAIINVRSTFSGDH